MLSTNDYEKMIEFVGGDPESMTDKTEKSMVLKVLEGVMDRTFIIDETASDYSTTDAAYGDKVKAALLTGKTIYVKDSVSYFVINDFKAINNSGNLQLWIYYYAGVTPELKFIGFAISSL